MNPVQAYLRWDEQTYVQYFREPAHKNIWFAFGTVFFSLAFGHAGWILWNYWERIPSAAQWTFVSAVIFTPLLWMRTARSHAKVRQLLAKARLSDPHAEQNLLKEVASGSLFVLWVSYVTLNLLFEVLLHFAFTASPPGVK